MKLVLKLLAGIVIVVVAAVSVALMMLDTEKLKPELQSMAAKQGIALDLAGDIGLSFFPSLGLNIANVNVDAIAKSDPANPPLLKVGQLNFSLAVMPLLAGEVKVAAIELKDTAIFAKIDKDGRGNWEDLEKPDATENTRSAPSDTSKDTPESNSPASTDEPSAISLSAELISLSNATLNFTDESQDLSVSVQPLNLSLTGVNLEDKPFDLLVNWVVNYQQGEGKEQTLIDNSGEMAMKIRVNSDNVAKLVDAKLVTTTSGQLPGVSIQEQTLSVTNINLTGKPMALTSQWQLDLAEPALTTKGTLSTDITLTAQDSSGTLSDKASPQKAQLSKLTLTNTLSAKTGSSQQNLSGQLLIQGIDQAHPHLSGELTLAQMNARELLKVLGIALDTANPKALEKVSANFSLEQQANMAALKNLKIVLDSSTITGFTRINNIEKQAVTGEIRIDKINVDDYLAPAKEESAQTASAPKPASSSNNGNSASSKSTAANEPDIIPVDMLRELDVDFKFSAGELIANKLKFETLITQVIAKDGIVSLSRLSSAFYQGNFNATADIDVRKAQAKIKQAGNFSGIAIEPLLKDLELDNEYKLKGLVAGTMGFKSNGNKQSQLMQALDGQMKFKGKQLLLAPINIEKQYCQIVALVEGGNKRAEINAINWPETTNLRDFNALVTVKDMKANIRQLQSGVENIQAGANGVIDLVRERFDIRVPVTLTADQTSAEGCKINSSFIKGRKLDLIRCEGGFNTAGEACGLDKDAANDLVEAYAKHEASKALKKHEDKIKKELGDEGGAVVNDLLNKWLKK